MNLASYCKSLGMTLCEYKAYREKIVLLAQQIMEKARSIYPANSGIYYPVDKILGHITDNSQLVFIIQELKKQGMEFYDNSTLWRL